MKRGRPMTMRAEREMDAEARHNAVVLDGDDVSESAAFKDMKQDSLPLKDQPIKGATTVGTDTVSESPPAVREVGPSPSLAPLENEVAALPALSSPKPLTETREKELQQKFSAQAGEIQSRLEILKAKLKANSGVVKPFLVAEAQELKELGDQLNRDLLASEWRNEATVFDKWHKRLTQLLNFLGRPAIDAKQFFDTVAFSFKQQQERAARIERERLEAEQRKRDQEARAAEIARLKAEERHEEAQIVQETPLPPPMAPPAKEVAPIAPGVSVVVSATLKSITDPAVFVLEFLAKNPSQLMVLFEPRIGAWKQFLTSHLDKKTNELSIAIPGIEHEISGSSRSRKANGDV